MRIVHLSTSDLIGGASRAAYRQHQALLRHGIDSRMFVLSKSSDDPTVIGYDYHAPVSRRIGRRIKKVQIELCARAYQSRRPEGYEKFDIGESHLASSVVHQLPECDVINLHWIAGLVDFRTFFRTIPPRKPLVWTLHDMNPFTGGCHYDFGCGRYRERCGRCPQLGSRGARDLSARTIQMKRAAMGRTDAHRFRVVAPSRWLAEEARSSSLFRRFTVDVIPYGLDTDVFRPRDRRSARERFSLPADANIMLFVARGAGARRKGFTVLAEAAAGISGADESVLVSVGGKKPHSPAIGRHVHLGNVAGDEALAYAYSAADVLIVPSLEDNLPLTVLEALACGTPVIGADVGGIPDVVISDQTGYVVPKGDVAALSAALERCFADPENIARLSESARRFALDYLDLRNNAQRYHSVYSELVQSEGPV